MKNKKVVNFLTLFLASFLCLPYAMAEPDTLYGGIFKTYFKEVRRDVKFQNIQHFVNRYSLPLNVDVLYPTIYYYQKNHMFIGLMSEFVYQDAKCKPKKCINYRDQFFFAFNARTKVFTFFLSNQNREDSNGKLDYDDLVDDSFLSFIFNKNHNLTRGFFRTHNPDYDSALKKLDSPFNAILFDERKSEGNKSLCLNFEKAYSFRRTFAFDATISDWLNLIDFTSQELPHTLSNQKWSECPDARQNFFVSRLSR